MRWLHVRIWSLGYRRDNIEKPLGQ
jgi:hypothetical protein